MLLFLTLGIGLFTFVRKSQGTPLEENIIIKNFKTGNHQYHIAGKEAKLHQQQLYLTSVQVRLYGEMGPLFLFSPECYFNRETQKGYGEKSVHVRNKVMTIYGTGFILDIAQKKVIIQKDVRVKIYHDRRSLLGIFK